VLLVGILGPGSVALRIEGKKALFRGFECRSHGNGQNLSFEIPLLMFVEMKVITTCFFVM
jgi:hypothetical protein